MNKSTYANTSFLQMLRFENRMLRNKTYSDDRYYFTGVIVSNYVKKDENYDDSPDTYQVKLVAQRYQFNTSIVIDRCRKTRIFALRRKHSALKYSRKFPIGQPVIWKRKRIGGKC